MPMQFDHVPSQPTPNPTDVARLRIAFEEVVSLSVNERQKGERGPPSRDQSQARSRQTETARREGHADFSPNAPALPMLDSSTPLDVLV